LVWPNILFPDEASIAISLEGEHMRPSFKNVCLLLAASLGIVQGSLAQASPTPPAKSCVGKANKTKVSGYVVLLRLRWDIFAKWKETGVWPDEAEANKALDGHSSYWSQQLKQGRAIFAGAMNGDYWDNAAMIVFEAASPQEAETLVKNDPAVRAHVFQAQVRPFDMFWLTNKYAPDVAVCAEGSGTANPSEKPPANK
jgi:uncharacterized protein YciI